MLAMSDAVTPCKSRPEEKRCVDGDDAANKKRAAPEIELPDAVNKKQALLCNFEDIEGPPITRREFTALVQSHVKLDHEFDKLLKLQAEVGLLVTASRNLLQKLLNPTGMEANLPPMEERGGQQQAQQETKDKAAPTGYHRFTVVARPKMLALAVAKGFDTTSSQA